MGANGRTKNVVKSETKAALFLRLTPIGAREVTGTNLSKTA